MKDVPPAKKMKLELFLLMMKTMNNAIHIFLISFSVSVHLALVLHSIKMLFTVFLSTSFYKS